MTDRKVLQDPSEPPEDVASLYSWANLHGAKYRDFSALRAQNREMARQQLQQVTDEEREREMREAEAQQAEVARRAAEAALAEDRARQAEMAAQQAAQHAAQHAAQQAAQRAAQEMARHAAEQAAQEARAAQEQAAQHADAARAAQQAAQRAAWQQPFPERFAPPAPYTPPPLPTPYTPPAAFRPSQAAAFAPPAYQDYSAAAFPPVAALAPAEAPLPGAAFQPTGAQPPLAPGAPVRDDNVIPPVRTPWTAPEPRENPSRPAWLAERLQAAAPGATQTDDTIQGSRDRLTTRWFALKAVFDGGIPAPEAPAPTPPRPPVLALFSLAGGVGKTSLAATLGRVLSSRGERVLLVDTAVFGLLPFYFGAREHRPGQLRTFSPPAICGDAPIQLIAIDPETLEPDSGGQEPLTAEIQQHSRGVGRVIVDLATASGATTRRILRLSPLVLVPVVPDMNSVVSVGAIDAFFEHHSSLAGKPMPPCYVLNQFDASLPLHLDVREVLREQLGDRLLPFALRRAPAVSEALAEGMTVIDYAPNSTVAEDFGSLAGWIKSQSAPASTGFRGVRWSER